jgi:hypothetical protein
MKKLFLVPILFGVLLTSSFFSACGNAEQKNNEQRDSIDSVPSKKDSLPQAAYICPMGAECGTGDKPGKCASCGMDLIENKHKKEQL